MPLTRAGAELLYRRAAALQGLCVECDGDADTCTCDSSTPPTKEIVLQPGEATRDAIARAFNVPRERVQVTGSDRFSVTVRVHPEPEQLRITTNHIRETTDMPTTTPMDAESVEREALKTITLEEAADLAAQHEQASRTAAISAERRNRAVASLLQRGHTTAQIAQAFGVTPGRIRQIAAAGRRES